MVSAKKKNSTRMKKSNKTRILIIAGSLLVLVIVIGIVGSRTFQHAVSKGVFTVNDENDDGRTFTVVHNEKGYGNEFEAWALLQLSPSYSFGVKFDNLSVNQGVKITKAYIELYSVGGPGLQHPNCQIYCDNVDNAQNFSQKGVLDISGRIYTNHSTLWNAIIPYGTWVQTPSVVTSLQEVINRVNWTSGNAVAFLFVTKGNAEDSVAFRNYDTGYPAKLYVEWETS